MRIDGSGNGQGSLDIELVHGLKKQFKGWDEEDQGLFACKLNGEQWDPSKRGIPASLTVSTQNYNKVDVSADRPGISLSRAGEPVGYARVVSHTSPIYSVPTEQKTASEENQKTSHPEKGLFSGLNRGFLS